MSRSHQIKRRRFRGRRWIGAVLLVSFVVSSVPIPVSRSPIDSTPENLVSQTPIADKHRCGCCAGGHCGQSCCCSKRNQVLSAENAKKFEPMHLAVVRSSSQTEPTVADRSISKPTARQKDHDNASGDVDSAAGYLIASLVNHCNQIPWDVTSLPWATVPLTCEFKSARQDNDFPHAMNAALESLSPEPPVPPPRLTTAVC